MIPQSVRRAAALVALQGAAVMAGAVVFVVRGLTGADQHIVNGFGNAMWFGVFGSALLAAASKEKEEKVRFKVPNSPMNAVAIPHEVLTDYGLDPF